MKEGKVIMLILLLGNKVKKIMLKNIISVFVIVVCLVSIMNLFLSVKMKSNKYDDSIDNLIKEKNNLTYEILKN